MGPAVFLGLGFPISQEPHGASVPPSVEDAPDLRIARP